MHVKICGIQSLTAAKTAVQYGADLLGFVFADSKRAITAEKARLITDELPENIKNVGVFVNESVSHMESVAALAGLDYIQLHGNEPPTVAAQLSLPVIKAFPADIEKMEEIRQYPCSYVLLDHPSGGGTGKTFEWQQFKAFHREIPHFFLAGGLQPDNVQNAIRLVHPFGVDVSSGVETNGQKDPCKIQRFLKNAKNRKDVEHDRIENKVQ